MATRPSKFITWTDGNATKISEPSTPLKLSGWIGGVTLPAENINWLWYYLDLWTQWLDYITNPATLISTITATKTGAFPVKTYLCNPTGGAFTFTLPDATSIQVGHEMCLKNIATASSNNVTVSRSGANLIENGTTATLSPGDVQYWISDGTNWWLV